MGGHRRNTGRPTRAAARALRLTERLGAEIAATHTATARLRVSTDFACAVLARGSSPAAERDVDDLATQIRLVAKRYLTHGASTQRGGTPTLRSTHHDHSPDQAAHRAV